MGDKAEPAANRAPRLWLDANVLLRFLTGDPKDLFERSVKLMARAERGEIVLVVTEIVFAEVVWVLKSFYKRSMDEIAEVLVPLLSAPGIEADDRELLIRAVELARAKNVDFIDAALALRAAARGEKVCTFDKTDFRRLPVSWLSP